MRHIGLVTVGRSDYGIYGPVLRQIRKHGELDLLLFVSGMHLSPEFGQTEQEIVEDRYTIAERVEVLLSSDSPEGVAKSMGLGVLGFAQAFARTRPDILVVLGDRFEMHSAALAALPFKIPVAHIHGGESTEGAIDDALRHSITKLSHLHFVSIRQYADRIAQMGEEPWRIFVVGAPGIDNIRETPPMSLAEFERRFGFALIPPPLLVTFHPVTLEYERTDEHLGELLAAIRLAGKPVLLTYPNADTMGRRVLGHLRQFLAEYSKGVLVPTFGVQGYITAMRHAAAMVGNSSSGIIEAPSLGLPVVNVGTRQGGRIRAANVIDVGYGREAILAAIMKATSPEFRRGLRDLENPYGDGSAAARIAKILGDIELGERLVQKRFVGGSPRTQ